MIDFVLYDSMSMIDTLVEKFEEGTEDPETGERETLSDGDERIIILNCMNYLAECIFNKINVEANNNLALFAEETPLIYKGIERNVYRIQPKQATCLLRFTASALATANVTIPKGTKVTADGKIFFATDKDVECVPGGTVDVVATSTEATKLANGYAFGQLNVIVNTLPYIEKVVNLTTSSGGGDIEDLEDFRERVVLAPLAYTATGTEAAYIQKTRGVSASIIDVAVTHVDNNISVYLLCEDGELPSEELIEMTEKYLTQNNIKALTDKITVKPAERVEYSINLTYKVSKPDQTRASEIKENVEAAIDEYIDSIGLKMGKAINPEMLKKVAYVAGASSVEVVSPAYNEIAEYEVAYLKDKTITYGGIL